VNASDVRVPHPRLIVVIGALIASAAILWLARNLTFYYDEWTFILSAPDWTAATLLKPHNEHPVMITRAIYAVLLSTMGLRSYMPYMAALLAVQAAAVVLLFEVVRRRAGDLVGLGSAALLMVLGSGWENLLWAFQIQFVGSVACGLGLLLALHAERTRRNLVIAAVLLTASLMFSGVGLFFGVAGAAELALTPARRRDLLWFAPTAIALGVWFVVFGRNYEPTTPVTPADLPSLPLYVTWGVGSGAGGLIGVSGIAGLAVLALAAIAVVVTWIRGARDVFRVGIVAGLVSFYAVTGLIRVQLGFQQSGAARYTYIGAVFWMLLLADSARYLPWRGAWRPLLVVAVLASCVSNSFLLYAAAGDRTNIMKTQIADLQALAAVRGDRCLEAGGAVDPLVMPAETDPALYYRAIDRYGDPSAGRPVTDRAAFDRGRANLLQPGCN
jgi:hypothetical protein